MEADHASTTSSYKETLKHLRVLRKETVLRVTSQVKGQRKTVASLMDALRSGPKTVPEMAQLTGLTTQEVLWWVASLKKYGQIMEGEKEGAYFTYRMVQGEAGRGGNSKEPTDR